MQLNSELLRLGMAPTTLRRQLAANERVSVRRGASRVAGKLTPEQEHLELIRATLGLARTPAVVSHLSAAVVHGLPVSRRRLDHVHLLRPGPFRTKTNGIVVRHQQPTVASMTVREFPVTPLAETATDTIRMSSFRDGVAIADAALRRNVPRERLLTLAAADPQRKGNPLLRRVVDFADGRAESAGESHARVQMAIGGIPAPDLQLVLTDRQGEMRVDFAWPELRLVAEFDGFVKYGRALLGPDADLEAAIEAEKRRELRIRRLGWWIVRLVWQDLRSPATVATIVNDGIEAARPLALLHQHDSAA